MKRGDRVMVVGVVSQVYKDPDRGIIVQFPVGGNYRRASCNSGVTNHEGTLVKGIEVHRDAVFEDKS